MSIVEKAAARLKRQEGASVDDAPSDVARDAVAGPQDERRPDGRITRVTLDDVRLRRIGMMPPESMDLWLTREFQRIKRPLLSRIGSDEATTTQPLTRIMFTSANPGDGKSFITFNLALSLANEMDYSVLLIDGDVAKPGITRALGLENEPGLIHLLTDREAPAESCVIPTDEPRLSILPSGRRSRGAVERLSSRRMGELLDELGTDETRLLIIDSAPLLAAAESQALAGHVGQIVMVVAAGKTEQRAVTSALSLIEPSGAEISCVLNQTETFDDDRHAGYYGVYPGEADGSE
ncbi:CpsD/CapB family tyrosine-protein kinase [Salinisphaera sp. Q1T1-3]|uniref:CpsD/CapB family tyrosine-protein kinase n=1 Tax=Salinisphaera sp. Q1T1-3 TaxID=2321229 RepID=UPI000E7669D2|nr:CpsD/CapB family tyrosine-protein kinase [Salinisphaera sp. Q1T1-3]RJS94716.1 hypothetical protein D3260_02765 [Salinisphaera sp. Q1T1-3]